MSIKSVLSVCVLCLMISFPAVAVQDSLTIHYPPDRITKEYDLLGISFSAAKGSADRFVIKINNETIKEITSLERVNCISLHLEAGTNTIDVIAIKDQVLVSRATRNVFLRSDLIGAYKNAPPDYRKGSFHGETWKMCSECHQLEPADEDRKPLKVIPLPEGSKAMVEREITSTCYSCHKGIMSYAFVHGPASVWGCLTCHDENSKPRYAVAKPDTVMCFKCHQAEQELWLSKQYTHGPVSLGKCTICHSPHASRHAFNLYKSTWDLCVNCHYEMGSGRHILGDSLSQRGHPTSGKDDPVRIGRELSCASCHNPHASDFPHLWAFEVKNLFEFCQKCHQKNIK